MRSISNEELLVVSGGCDECDLVVEEGDYYDYGNDFSDSPDGATPSSKPSPVKRVIALCKKGPWFAKATCAAAEGEAVLGLWEAFGDALVSAAKTIGETLAKQPLTNPGQRAGHE